MSNARDNATTLTSLEGDGVDEFYLMTSGATSMYWNKARVASNPTQTDGTVTSIWNITPQYTSDTTTGPNYDFRWAGQHFLTGAITGATLFGNRTDTSYSLTNVGSTITTLFGFTSVVTLGATNVANATEIANYQAQGFTNSGSGTVTTAIGYRCADLSVGTNRYAFQGLVTSGTGKWNCYMSGTALNYMNGALLIGGTTDNGVKLDVTGDSIRIATAKTPATAGAAGVAGQIAWDANYIYVCVGASQWKRAAIATW